MKSSLIMDWLRAVTPQHLRHKNDKNAVSPSLDDAILIVFIFQFIIYHYQFSNFSIYHFKVFIIFIRTWFLIDVQADIQMI